MPFILLAIAIILIIAALNDKIGALGTQISTDITATQGGVSFVAWFAAIVVIGLLGYIPGLQGFSRALMVLVITVIVVKGGTGFFSKLTQQIETPPAPAGNVTISNLTLSPVASTSGVSSVASLLPSITVPGLGITI
jgi:hypothetical protein